MNNIISQNQENIKHNQRYIPHLLQTRYHAVKTYRNGNSVSFVCRRYKISKASLMRWNKRFDGSIDFLRDKSHRPLSKHPNSHTDTEIYWIKNLIRRNPNISLIELYAKLKLNKGYTRHPCSLFRFLRKLGFFKMLNNLPNPMFLNLIILLLKLVLKCNLMLNMFPILVMLVNTQINSTNIQLLMRKLVKGLFILLRNNLLIVLLLLLKWLFPIEKRKELLFSIV